MTRGLDLTDITTPQFLDRFWSKVDTTGDCWEWLAHRKKPYFYGQFTLRKGVFVGAHTVSYALTHDGVIPPGFHVCHHCDNPPCVRPDHLFLGTPRDNALDSVRKGRANRSRGENHRCARLTEADVREIRATPIPWGQQPVIAARYGIRVNSLQKVIYGQTWRHIT